MTTVRGFGVLMYSSLMPLQQFGMGRAITIAYFLVAAIVVVPPSMFVWAAFQNYHSGTWSPGPSRRWVKSGEGVTGESHVYS